MNATHQWHYVTEGLLGNNQTVGPISEAELLALAAQGKLRRETIVSSPTRTNGQWRPLAQIAGLLQILEQGEQQRQTAKMEQQRLRQEQVRATEAARDVQFRQNQAAAASEHAALAAISCCQDLVLVKSIRDRVLGIITSQEQVQYIAVQQKPVINMAPDAIVCTNRRLIFYRPKLLGRYEFQDYLWFDLHNAHIKQNMLGATFTAQHVSGQVVSLDYLPKDAAQMLYRIAQEREEQARIARYEMHVNTLRAGAAQVNVQTHVPAAPAATATPQDDLVKRMETLKSMADKGLITPEDFERRKQEILAQL